MDTIDRNRLMNLMSREQERFGADHPVPSVQCHCMNLRPVVFHIWGNCYA
jgi:hypothetical protein